MMKIKIIHILSGLYRDYSDFEEVVRSITEWEEVSDEDYDYLRSYHGTQYLKRHNLCVLDMPPQEEIIPETVAGIKKAVKKAEDEYNEHVRKQKEKAEQTAEKKRLKAVEKAKKLLKEAGEL